MTTERGFDYYSTDFGYDYGVDSEGNLSRPRKITSPRPSDGAAGEIRQLLDRLRAVPGFLGIALPDGSLLHPDDITAVTQGDERDTEGEPA